MTGEWRLWKFSKFDNPCDDCGEPIPRNAPRYSMRDDKGFYHNLCLPCAVKKGIGAPQQEKPTTSNPSREENIAKAHEENMQSARETRNCIALLVTAINELTKAVKGDGK